MPAIKKLPKKQKTKAAPALLPVVTLALIILFRVVNAFALQTYFQPDEYFQSWEKAHDDVFGYGIVTWEWKKSLRSGIVPWTLARVFKWAQSRGVSHETVTRVFMGLVAATGDVFTAKLAFKLTKSREVAYTALGISVLSAFNWFISTRAFSNTFEMVINVVALYFWPFETQQVGLLPISLSLILANLNVMIRPTAAALWVILGFQVLWLAPSKKYKALLMFYMPILSLYIQIKGMGFEAGYQAASISPMVMFLILNYTMDIASFYGRMPWFFYLTSGLPMLLLGFLPFFVWAYIKTGPKSLFFHIIWSQVALFSYVAHKEVRFLLFLLPIMHVLIAMKIPRKPLLIGVAVNIPVALYLGFVHNRGVMDLVRYIRDDSSITEVSFLMPCHSTPMHSLIHRPELEHRLHTLNCDPAIMTFADSSTYIDEADQFYADPSGFLDQHPEKLATTIVYFEDLAASVSGIVEKYGYYEAKRFFNSHFHDDDRRRGDIIVLKRGTDVYPEVPADNEFSRPPPQQGELQFENVDHYEPIDNFEEYERHDVDANHEEHERGYHRHYEHQEGDQFESQHEQHMEWSGEWHDGGLHDEL